MKNNKNNASTAETMTLNSYFSFNYIQYKSAIYVVIIKKFCNIINITFSAERENKKKYIFTEFAAFDELD